MTLRIAENLSVAMLTVLAIVAAFNTDYGHLVRIAADMTSWATSQTAVAWGAP